MTKDKTIGFGGLDSLEVGEFEGGADDVYRLDREIDPPASQYRQTPEEIAEGRRYSAMSFAVELAKMNGSSDGVLDAAAKIEAFLRGDEEKTN